MLPHAGIIAALTVALLATGSTLAADNKLLLIKGKVIGDNGKPQEGAEVRALRVDAKGPEIVAITNTRGEYVLTVLPVGAYSVTAYFNGFARSRAIIKTASKGWAKVDFDLGLDQGRGDGVDRMQRDLRGFLTIPNANPH